MLELLSLLQARRDWPGHVLAERLGVTTRTVRRDIDRLRALGYAIDSTKGPDGGYRLAAGAELPPLLFDDEQAVALAVALRYATTSGVELGESAERALATVRQVMPSRLRHRVDAIDFTTPTVDERVDPGVLEAVSRAVNTKVTMRFDYGGGPGPTRLVEPHGLVARHSRWYLVAWDLDRSDWRTFRVDRMEPRGTAGEPFSPRPIPTGDAATFVAARAKGSDDEDRWPCVGSFEIDLSARELVRWVPDGEVIEAGPIRSLVTTGSWSWSGLLATIIRFGAPFRVVGPAELIEESRRLASWLDSAPSAEPNNSATAGERP